MPWVPKMRNYLLLLRLMIPEVLHAPGKIISEMDFYLPLFKERILVLKSPPANLQRPSSYSAADDKSTINLLAQLNGKHLERYPGDANLAARIASYELAGKMQTSIPDVMDISNEPKSIKKLYGIETGTDLKKSMPRIVFLLAASLRKEFALFSCLTVAIHPEEMESRIGILIVILIKPMPCRQRSWINQLPDSFRI